MSGSPISGIVRYERLPGQIRESPAHPTIRMVCAMIGLVRFPAARPGRAIGEGVATRCGSRSRLCSAWPRMPSLSRGAATRPEPAPPGATFPGDPTSRSGRARGLPPEGVDRSSSPVDPPILLIDRQLENR